MQKGKQRRIEKVKEISTEAVNHHQMLTDKEKYKDINQRCKQHTGKIQSI